MHRKGTQHTGDGHMIKRIAAAVGVAALLGTSAAALAGSSVTLYSTQLEQPKPVVVSGQGRVTDWLSSGGATGVQGTTSTTSTTSSVDIGTAIRTSTQTTQAVEQPVSDGGCSTDCGLVDEPAEQAAAEDAYRAQASDQASDAEPMMEDDPGWDCHTMGNHICGPGHG